MRPAEGDAPTPEGCRRSSPEGTARGFDEAKSVGPEIAAPKPYVSIRDLSLLTPWTEQAIRTMISKGTFQAGRHYFHVGRRPMFRWDRVVDFIEGRDLHPTDAIPMRKGGFLGGAPEK